MDITTQRFIDKNIVYIYAILIINTIASLTVNYFEAKSLNPGTIRAAFVAFIIIMLLKRVLVSNRLIYHVLAFLFYIFFLVMLSSNVAYSFYNFVKLALALMMFPLGYFFFRTFENLVFLSKIVMISLGLFSINFIISNIFNLGTSDYLDETVYFGSGRVNIAKAVSFLLLIVPIFFRFAMPKNKFYLIITVIVTFVSLLIVFLAVKRSALLVVAVGFFIYFVFSPQKSKKIKYLLIIGLLALATSSFYLDMAIARFQAREKRFDIENPEFAETEGRILEYDKVINDYRNRNVFQILFGTEMFNDQAYYKSYRMLHTDYMILLHGAGIVGLLWFFYIYLLIVLKILYYSNKLNIVWVKELRAISLSIFSGAIILSVAGVLYSVDILSFLFLFSGAAISVLRNTYYCQNPKSIAIS